MFTTPDARRSLFTALSLSVDSDPKGRDDTATYISGECGMAAKCRFCQTELAQTLIDFGLMPATDALLAGSHEADCENAIPLHVMVCHECWLVQTTINVPKDTDAGSDVIISNPSPQVSTMADSLITRFKFQTNCHAVEIASSRDKAGDDLERNAEPFPGQRYRDTDIVICNVQVERTERLLDFASGLSALLKPKGIATFEFHHLANLIEDVQLDAITHSRPTYLSLAFIERLVQAAGLAVFDVQVLPKIGGSLRAFVAQPGRYSATERLSVVRAREAQLSLTSAEGFHEFSGNVEAVLAALQEFLRAAATEGRRVAVFGAGPEACTVLNAAKVSSAQIAMVVDPNTDRHGKLLPGSHIAVQSVDVLSETAPDYLLVLPWSTAPEVVAQHGYIRSWGGQFAIMGPELWVG